VLGLRAMYSLLAELLLRLKYLRQGLALILVFVGTKMLIAPLKCAGSSITCRQGGKPESRLPWAKRENKPGGAGRGSSIYLPLG